MYGTWYPSLEEQRAAERHLRREPFPDEEPDWRDELLELAAEGDVDALLALRRELPVPDYDELGWGD